jgi:hypothetical protein
VSSDGYGKVWETFDSNGKFTSNILVSQFCAKPTKSRSDFYIPSSASWIETSIQHIVAGFTNSNSLILFDQERIMDNSMAIVGSILINQQANYQPKSSIQPNK